MAKRSKSKSSIAFHIVLCIFVVICVFGLGFVCAQNFFMPAPIIVAPEPRWLPIGLGPEPEPGRNQAQTGNPPVYPTRPPEYPLRGQKMSYQQLGVLVRRDRDPDRESGAETSPIMLPLFGRKLTTRDRWEYYCASDKFHMMQLPVVFERRDCQDDVGCEEIYNGQHVTVPDYGDKPFVARIYKYNVNALN